MHRIVELVSVADCGTVIHPDGPRHADQGRRGAGLGMAALERAGVRSAESGLPANVGFHQQKPPSYLDLPTEMQTDAVDKADPSNPVGAKGVGEPLHGRIRLGAVVRHFRCHGRTRVQPHAGACRT